MPDISGTADGCSQHNEPWYGRPSLAVVSAMLVFATTPESMWRKPFRAEVIRERRAQDRYLPGLLCVVPTGQVSGGSNGLGDRDH